MFTNDSNIDRTGWQYLLPLLGEGPIGVLGSLGKRDMDALAARGSDIRILASERNLSQEVDQGFDAIVVADKVTTSSVDHILAAIRPGGALWILSASELLGREIRRRGYRSVVSFAKLPDSDRLRLLAPISEGGRVLRSALQMHSHGRTRDKLKSTIYGWGAYRLSQAGFGPKTSILAKAPDGYVPSLWEMTIPACDSPTDLIPAVLSASPGTGRKAIIAGFSKNGEARYFTKISDSAMHARNLNTEASILADLSSRARIRTLRIPAVLSKGNLGSSSFLTLAPIGHYSPPSPNSMPPVVIEALSELVKRTSRIASVHSTNLWRRLEVAGEEDVLFARVIEVISPDMANYRFPIGIAHRDFVFWNMGTVDNGVAVLDWEWAESRHIPLQDFFHYYLHGSVNVSGLPPIERAFEIFFNPSRRFLSDLRSYLVQTSIPSDRGWNFFLLYISDWVMLQHELGNAETVQVRGYRELLAKLLSDESMSRQKWLGGTSLI